MSMHRTLKMFDVFSIATGAMISSGIFILPGVVFPHIGPALFVAYFLAGVVSLIGILNVIELSTAMPKAGGDYYFVTRSMGPLVGTVSGVLSWMALILKSAFAIYGMCEILRIFFPSIPVSVAGLAFTVLFVAFNLLGVRAAAILENIMVIVLLFSIVFYVVFGLPQIKLSAFTPFFLPGKGGRDIIIVAAMVYISYGGLLHAISISEEVVKPSRNIPLGIILSIVTTTFLYVAILIVTIGVLPVSMLAGNTTSLAETAKIFSGTTGYVLLTIGAILAFTTTAHAGIMSSSRYPFALSRDGLLPRFVSLESVKSRNPWVAIMLTGVIMAVAVQLPLETLVKAASAVILASYVLASFAVIILRESKLLNYRPTFKVPLYPFFQIVSILIFSALIIDLGWDAIRINLIVILFSSLAFMFYGRRTNREYALLHLLERITNRKLTAHGLEKELREVLHSRDEIIKDEFDLQIERSEVLDLGGTMCTTTLFRAVADHFAGDIGLVPDRFYELLQEREKESSTAINSYVAIPHVILDGNGVFKIFLVRCRDGVGMAGADSLIKAAFVICGTRDCRHHHLRALAAIAQIIQSPNFETRWNHARTENQLRDIMLLGKRKRNAPGKN